MGEKQLDVTLQRPDVTLYGLIDLLICYFSLTLFGFYKDGCVRECLFILKTEFPVPSIASPRHLRNLFYFLSDLTAKSHLPSIWFDPIKVC